MKIHEVRGGCPFVDNFTHLLCARIPLEFAQITQIPDWSALLERERESVCLFRALHDSCRHRYNHGFLNLRRAYLKLVLRDTCDYLGGPSCMRFIMKKIKGLKLKL